MRPAASTFLDPGGSRSSNPRKAGRRPSQPCAMRWSASVPPWLFDPRPQQGKSTHSAAPYGRYTMHCRTWRRRWAWATSMGCWCVTGGRRAPPCGVTGGRLAARTRNSRGKSLRCWILSGKSRCWATSARLAGTERPGPARCPRSDPRHPRAAGSPWQRTGGAPLALIADNQLARCRNGSGRARRAARHAERSAP